MRTRMWVYAVALAAIVAALYTAASGGDTAVWAALPAIVVAMVVADRSLCRSRSGDDA